MDQLIIEYIFIIGDVNTNIVYCKFGQTES
jgi:hypothetical protein